MKQLKLETGKIVGAGNNISWAQNHIFIPNKEDKKSAAGILLVSFAIQAKEERLDITSFGKEIISRFHEIYYSTNINKPIKRIKKTINSLSSEFSSQISLQLCCAVILQKNQKTIGYFASYGQSKAFIQRNSKLAQIINGQKEIIKTSSGHLQSGDKILLAAEQFFKHVNIAQIKSALNNEKTEQITEDLAPIVHASPENSKTSAIIAKINLLQKKQPPQPAKTIPEKKQLSKKKTKHKKRKPLKGIKKTIKTIPALFKNIKYFTKKTAADFKKRPDVFIKDRQKKARAKKTTLTVAIILIILLIVSVFFGSKRKQTQQSMQKVKGVYDSADYKLEQAQDLKELNPLRARGLLNEAKQEVENALSTLEEDKKSQQLKTLLQKVKDELEKVGGEYQYSNADLFLDLTLIKDNFNGLTWENSNGTLQVLDPSLGTILEIEVEDKSAKVSGGGEKIKQSQNIGADEQSAFIIKDNKLLLVNLADGELKAEKEGKDWGGKIIDLIGFAGNAYLLDENKGKIWKYTTNGFELNDPLNYFQVEEFNLKYSQDMAIDGSVWVLFSNGTIVKFTRGIKDAFQITGLENEFKEPEKIFADAQADNLYVLDRMNTRVVAINKQSGEYTAQYIWSGIAGVKDLYVSEQLGKILLLTGERIYQLELKK